MSSPFAAEGLWHKIDYDAAWAAFDARFGFAPDFYERSRPAITLPEGCLVIDLSSVFSQPGATLAASESAVNAAALRAFVALAGADDVVALDWQHPAYRYSPAAMATADLHYWPVPVFPNGDYFAHVGPGVSWGTFGHPWQQTLTIWGSPLVQELGTELLTWLPRHPQSRDL